MHNIIQSKKTKSVNHLSKLQRKAINALDRNIYDPVCVNIVCMYLFFLDYQNKDNGIKLTIECYKTVSTHPLFVLKLL